uniref:Odorant receptor n=1 Tax=Ostrinia nubilalis TaxID=29057 RepID=J3SIP6_OSTNU|nr:E-race odorant receptor 3 [Ostrinia nubilalis]
MSAVDQNPSTLNYIKTVKNFLGASGIWPSNIFSDKLQPLVFRVHRQTLPYHTMLIVFGGLHYLSDNFHRMSFLDMGHMILSTFLAMVTAMRSVVPNLKVYAALVTKLGREIHLMHFAHKGPYYEEMNKMVDKASYIYTKFIVVVMYLAMLMFNFAPMYNNAKNVLISKTENYTMEFALYYSYPGFKPLNYFPTTTLYNFYLSYNCGIMLCGLDLVLFLMILQLIGHVYILRHNLENFPSPKNKVVLNIGDLPRYKNKENCIVEMFDAKENEEVRVRLAECIEHHKIIIRFTDEISIVFGPILAFNYMFHMVGCCLLLLECSAGNQIIRYGPLTTVVFGQLIQISVMFEMLGAETEKLKDSAYFVPWECMNTSNRRTAHIMLHKMQDKISIKALGLAAVGVNTMMGILKTTFSYYAFLQTMGD